VRKRVYKRTKRTKPGPAPGKLKPDSQAPGSREGEKEEQKRGSRPQFLGGGNKGEPEEDVFPPLGAGKRREKRCDDGGPSSVNEGVRHGTKMVGSK